MKSITIVRQSSVVLGLPEQLVSDRRVSMAAKYAMLRLLSHPAGSKFSSLSDMFLGENEDDARACVKQLREFGYISIEATSIGDELSDFKVVINQCDDVLSWSTAIEQPVYRITCKHCGKWWMSNEDQSPGADTLQGFDEFWDLWPRKYLKAEAKKKWAAKHCHLHLAKILESVKQHCASRQWREGFIPMVTTWINQNRWEEDISQLNVNLKTKQGRQC